MSATHIGYRRLGEAITHNLDTEDEIALPKPNTFNSPHAVFAIARYCPVVLRCERAHPQVRETSEIAWCGYTLKGGSSVKEENAELSDETVETVGKCLSHPDEAFEWVSFEESENFEPYQHPEL